MPSKARSYLKNKQVERGSGVTFSHNLTVATISLPVLFPSVFFSKGTIQANNLLLISPDPRKAELTVLSKVSSKSTPPEMPQDSGISPGNFDETEPYTHRYYFAIHAPYISVAGKILASQTSLVNQQLCHHEKINLIPRRCIKFKLAFTPDCQREMKSIITVIHSCFHCRK